MSSEPKRRTCGIIGRRAALAAGGLILAICFSVSAAEKIVWKAFPTALLRIDDSPPKIWNLYHTGKKVDPLLLQLGGRDLLFYLRDQMVYELDPTKLEHHGAELLWNDTDRPEKPLPSTDWNIRDVGFAWRIRFTLMGEGRKFDVQVPQTPDLKSLY